MCYARRQRSSWARIKLSKSLYQNTDLSVIQSFCFRVLLLASFTFCWVVFSSVRISEIRFKLFALYFSLVVQFSKIISVSRSRVPTFLLYHISSALSIPFLKSFLGFFKKFWSQLVRCGLSLPSALAVSLYILPLFFLLVKNFFDFFLIFLTFCRFVQNRNDKNHDILSKQPTRARKGRVWRSGEPKS